MVTELFLKTILSDNKEIIAKPLMDAFKCPCGSVSCDINFTDWEYYWNLKYEAICNWCGEVKNMECHVTNSLAIEKLEKLNPISKIEVRFVRPVLDLFDTVYKGTFKNLFYA
jgi:hypothetical protein